MRLAFIVLISYQILSMGQNAPFQNNRD